jgi:hypothetical protein
MLWLLGLVAEVTLGGFLHLLLLLALAVVVIKVVHDHAPASLD